MESIDHESRERIDRFGEEGVLPGLREALGQRPEWRGFDARQLGAAVDAGDFPFLRFDHRRFAPVRCGDHDDVGEVIFLPRIVVADARQQLDQFSRPHRHQS